MTKINKPMKTRVPSALLQVATAAALAATLAACGGSDDDPAAPAPPVAPASITLGGTAATGAGLGGAAIDVKCQAGMGSTTTQASGAYTVSITGGTFPCLARATATDGTVLISVAVSGAGGSATANITPVTQLVVANLAAGDPAAYFGSFDANAAAAVSAVQVQGAVTAVVGLLKAGGVDFSAVGDLLGGGLVVASGSASGYAYDQALVALQTSLTQSGTTLAALTTAVATQATGATAAGAPTSSSAASLPPEMLLKPAAASCPALRSGSYRMIVPTPNAGLADQTGLLQLDASSLAVTYTDGSTGSLAADGGCQFSDDAGKTTVAVSQAGVLVARSLLDGTSNAFHPVVGFPAQSHTLAELAGTWNLIGLERSDTGSGYTGVAGTFTLDAAGTMSDVSYCKNDGTWGLAGADCAAVTTGMPSLRANADGGFDALDAGATTASGRVFAYRAGNGDLMAVAVDGDGSLSFYTRQRSNALLAVGFSSSSWNFYSNANLRVPGAVDSTSYVVSSVDAAAGVFVRAQTATGYTRPETIHINNPRQGYNHRVAETVQTTDGASSNVVEWTALTMRGMGVTALVIPGSKVFDISAGKPAAQP